MWAAGAGFSIERDAEVAAREAAAQAGAAAGGADAALVFAGPAHRAAARALVAAVCAELGTTRVAGGLAHGVIGVGREQEGGAGVSVLAVRGLDAEPIWVPELAGNEEVVAEEVAARLAGGAREQDLVVLIPDPRALQPDALLARIRDAAGAAGVVGAGAGDPVSDAPLVWCGAVTQACRPATELLTITRVQGPWILELEGRPTLDVYREAAREPLADDLRRAAAFVLAALPRDAAAPLAPGGYLVRNIAGFAPDANAFAIPVALEKGDRIALVHREPETAREDLKAMLADLGSEPPGLGLYFDCCARGTGFFGVPGLESAYLQQALGAAPIAGMFGSCELGPIAGRAELLTYTGVLALLDR